jgi:hypothetical protein
MKSTQTTATNSSRPQQKIQTRQLRYSPSPVRSPEQFSAARDQRRPRDFTRRPAAQPKSIPVSHRRLPHSDPVGSRNFTLRLAEQPSPAEIERKIEQKKKFQSIYEDEWDFTRVSRNHSFPPNFPTQSPPNP